MYDISKCLTTSCARYNHCLRGNNHPSVVCRHCGETVIYTASDYGDSICNERTNYQYYIPEDQ